MSSKNNPKGLQIYEERVRARMAERLTNENLMKVERAFGYSFKNKNLLRQAFLKSYIHVLSFDLKVYEAGNDTFEFIVFFWGKRFGNMFVEWDILFV